MNNLHIWDLCEEKVYVKLDPHYVNKLFSYAIKVVNKTHILAKLLGIKVRTLYSYKYRTSAIPLRLLWKLFQIFPEYKKEEFKYELEKKVIEIKTAHSKSSRSLKNPKFPIRLSPALCNIAGHIIGDGFISFDKGDIRVFYSNQCKTLIDNLKVKMIEVFGDIEPYEIYYKNTHSWTIQFSSVLGIILTKLLRKQKGETKHIPEIIIDADKKSKSQFIKAIFDDEGSVKFLSRVITLEMTNRQIVEGIKEILKEFSIRTGKISKRNYRKDKIAYKFDISSRMEMERFMKEIGFNHPEKMKKLKLLLGSYKQMRYKHGDIENLIVEILKKEGEMTAAQLTKKLNRKSVTRFRTYHLWQLEKEGMIRSRKENKGLKVYYIP